MSTVAALQWCDYGACWFVCLNIDVIDAQKSVESFFLLMIFVSLLLSRYKLIRRRVIWLIGQWISVKFKSDLRPLLYEVILSLMQDPDLVVSQKCIFPPSGYCDWIVCFIWKHWMCKDWVGPLVKVCGQVYRHCPNIVNENCKRVLPFDFATFSFVLSLFSFRPDKSTI